MIRFAIEDCLAGSSRPGYESDRDLPVPKHGVDAWIADVKARDGTGRALEYLKQRFGDLPEGTGHRVGEARRSALPHSGRG